MKRRVENREKLKKEKCMNNYRNNTLNFLKRGKSKSNKK